MINYPIGSVSSQWPTPIRALAGCCCIFSHKRNHCFQKCKCNTSRLTKAWCGWGWARLAAFMWEVVLGCC